MLQKYLLNAWTLNLSARRGPADQQAAVVPVYANGCAQSITAILKGFLALEEGYLVAALFMRLEQASFVGEKLRFMSLVRG